MSYNDVSQAPQGMPPLDVVEESGTTQPGPGNTAWMRGAPGPAATQDLPHPQPQPVTEGEVPFDEVVGPEIDLAGLAEQIRQLATPQAMPWVFRGPVNALTDASAGGAFVLSFPMVPSGEVWEVERLSVAWIRPAAAAPTVPVEGGVYVGSETPQALRAVYNDNASFSVDGAGTVGLTSERLNPPIRIGAGSSLIVAGKVDVSSHLIGTMQYRMFRLPRPGHDRVAPVVRLP